MVSGLIRVRPVEIYTMFDPGSLIAVFIMLVTGLFVAICVIGTFIAWLLKRRETARKFSIAAGVCVLAGFALVCLAVALGSPEIFARHSNPIEGWKPIADVGCKDGQLSAEISPITGYAGISDDVQKFVNKLPMDGPVKWCCWIEDMKFYEDGTGQHAVGFQIPHSGTWWGYVLIYDKNNKRLKAIRYVQGHYMC